MNIYKKEKDLKPLVLNREILLTIEAEITKPWEELKKSISESIRGKISDHNREVKVKGYSFKISLEDDISKKTISKARIGEILQDETYIEKKLKYPIQKPKVSYIDDTKEIVCSNVVELYSHRLQSKFRNLSFTVYGDKSKVIEVSFCSYIGPLNSPPNANHVKVSSSDEAWTMLSMDRIVGILKKYESTSSIFDNVWIRFFYLIVLPIFTVYVINKFVGPILLPLLIYQEFRLWLFIVMFFGVFFLSMKLYHDLFEQLVPGSILDDEVPNKNKSLIYMGLSIVFGVISTIILDIARYFISFSK